MIDARSEGEGERSARCIVSLARLYTRSTPLHPHTCTCTWLGGAGGESAVVRCRSERKFGGCSFVLARETARPAGGPAKSRQQCKYVSE